MKERLKILVIATDTQHGDFKQGQTGYIDGYIRGGNDTPFACVIIGSKLVLCPFNVLEVLEL